MEDALAGVELDEEPKNRRDLGRDIHRRRVRPENSEVDSYGKYKKGAAAEMTMQ